MLLSQIALLAHHDVFSSLVIMGLETSHICVERNDLDLTARDNAGQPADNLFPIPIPGIYVFLSKSPHFTKIEPLTSASLSHMVCICGTELGSRP